MNNQQLVSQAVKQIQKVMHEEPECSWSWFSGFACAAYDAGLDTEHAEKAATRIMQECFGIDMSEHPYKEEIVEQTRGRGREKELVKYKHVRDLWGQMVGTICFCTDPKNGKKVYVGIAICARGDNFSRKIGRELSFGRAVRAFEKQSNSLPIGEIASWHALIVAEEPIVKEHPYLSFVHTHKG